MTPLFAALLQASAESQSFWDQLAQFFGAQDIASLLSWEFWLVLTILFLAGEILTAGFLLGALTPGTLLAGLVAAFGAEMELQFLAFSVGTVGGLVLIRPFFLRKAMVKTEPSNVEALLNRNATVTAAIPADGIGEVKIMSEHWRATAATAIAADTKVLVTKVEGNTLTVTPI